MDCLAPARFESLRWAGVASEAGEMNTETDEEVDLYELLGVSRSASKVEIKKAYHKAALASHPDKVPVEEREGAEIRFKRVSEAYDILYDDDKRSLYDRHGMSAFDRSKNGGGVPMDFEELFAQMFMGGSMGGMGGMPGMRDMPGMGEQAKERGDDEMQEYEITLEELYRGKTVKMSSTKNIVCPTCKGSGGKEKAKPTECAACKGRGRVTGLQSIGPGLVTQVTQPCQPCHGSGKVYKDKDKCKRCKGARVVETRKLLELYIPRGSREGDRIVLKGEADQEPDTEPGDIVFVLKEVPHDVFRRAGPDLAADIHITLAEALTGFNRVVLTHLDGRGLSLHVKQPAGRILRPEQVLKVSGEGMPVKRSEAKGDLYLVVKIDFPGDGWIRDDAAVQRIRAVLPGPGPPVKHGDDVDEVQPEFDASLDDFGAGSDDPRAGAEWEDEDEDEFDDGTRCAQQ